jgi:tripartite-type tricarboxylate transporter receptor subunit TctC
MFKQIADVNLLHVPYKTSPEAINAVLGKHADILFDTVSALIGQVKSGQLKALAVTGKDRFPAVPDVPPAADSGVLPGYDVTTWYGMFAPHGTPPAVVAKLNKTLIESLADEAVKKRMAAVGVVVKSSTPDEFRQFLASEYKRWNAVREAAGIPQQ